MSDKTEGFVPLAGAGKKQDIFTQLIEETSEEDAPTPQSDDDTITLEDAWHRLVILRLARDSAKTRASDASRAYEEQRGRMASMMERQGTKQFRGADGGGCSIADVYTTAVENEQEWLDWVRETHPELLSVHSQSRTRFIRENYRDKGVPIDDASFPPGLKAGTQPTLQVRGVRPPQPQGAKHE